MELYQKIYAKRTNKDYKDLWKKALIVFDTNTLLDIYRLPKSAKDDFVKILEDPSINDRIWIPFQVLLEFLEGRFEPIKDQKSKFSDVRTIINTAIKNIKAAENSFVGELNKLSLKKRHSVIDPDQFLNAGLFETPIKHLEKFKSELMSLQNEQPDVNNDDDIYKVVLKLFKNKIGESLGDEFLKELYKEGEERYKEEIPPGFEDKSKPGVLIYERKKYKKKFGDLIIWKELLLKAQNENLEYIIFVTNDMKDDWWLRKNEKVLGARPELLDEIYYSVKSVKFFHIYNQSSFMENARKQLLIDIKQDSIEETKDIINFENLNNDNSVSNFFKIIEQLATIYSVKINNISTMTKVPILLIPRKELFLIISEIIHNSSIYSDNSSLDIAYFLEDGYFTIYFINTFKNDSKSSIGGRGMGILNVIDNMLPYGEVNESIMGNQYSIQLNIENQFIIASFIN